MQVRERLRELIAQKVGGNQSELARRIGEHPNWVNYRLTGTTAIKADELPRLAAGLGIDVCTFFEEATHEQGAESLTASTGQRIARRALERLLDIPDEDLDAFTRVVEQLRQIHTAE
jgi:transcriptional regulator with XRE-family HTH domain